MVARLEDQLMQHIESSARGQRYKDAAQGVVNLGEMVQANATVCREKALFMHTVLAHMGIESEVVIGTVKVDNGSGNAGGHAWVKLPDGTIIDGTWGEIFPKGEGYPSQVSVRNVHLPHRKRLSTETMWHKRPPWQVRPSNTRPRWMTSRPLYGQAMKAPSWTKTRPQTKRCWHRQRQYRSKSNTSIFRM